ncbi:hypothetical protein HK098_001361 [Nowakowskiella sp. JEL0407]|nr:hypothetical protein HK098_001361 [Nowakowskiella sp. JEL0407]
MPSSKKFGRSVTIQKLRAEAKLGEFDQYKSIDFEEPDNPALTAHYKKQSKLTRGNEGIFQIENLFQAFLLAFGTCVAAALVPAILIIFFAPGAIGSGMTEVISFLNGNYNVESYSLVGTVLRLVGVFGICVAGFFTGFDGPFAQIGAAIGLLTVIGIKRSHTLRRVFYGEARKVHDPSLSTSDLVREKLGWTSLLSSLEAKKFRLYATLGASVAITAIFRSPIGGVMFALEETTSFFDLSVLWRTLASTVITYLIVSYQILRTTAAEGDSKKHFDLQNAVHFPVNNDCARPIPYQDFLSYAFMAVLAALLSQFWNMILGKVQKFRLQYIIRSHDNQGKKTPPLKGAQRYIVPTIRLVEVIVVCLLTSLVTVGIPMIPGLDDCTNVYVPTQHIPLTMPDTCANPQNATLFEDCLQTLNSVCIPNGLTDVWRQNIVDNYLLAYGNNATGTSQVATKAAGGGPVITNLPHRRQEHGGEPAPSGSSGHATATATGHLPSETGVAHPEGESTKGHLSPEEKKKKDTEALAKAAKKYSLSKPETKLLPYYSFVKDGMLGDVDNACYYQIRSLLFKSPEFQLKFILKRGLYALWSSKTLLVFILIYLIMSILTYYIALPTDLVIPNLIIGAISGRAFGLMVNFFKDKLSHSIEDPGVYALLGMAAAWSGTSRLTLTVVVVCLELTGDFGNIPGLLTVTVIAAALGRVLGPSLYHVELENNGVPFLDHEPGHGMHTRTIEEVLAVDVQKLFVMKEEEDISTIERAMTTTHGSFPVVRYVQDNGVTKMKPVGIVLWDRLAEALHKLEHGKLVKGRDVSELERRFPVGDLMNISPVLIRQGTSVSKVFKLVRTLGLKSVLVVDHSGYLMGIISRKDLIRLERLLHEEHQRHKKHGKHDKGGHDDHDFEVGLLHGKDEEDGWKSGSAGVVPQQQGIRQSIESQNRGIGNINQRPHNDRVHFT